MCRHFERKKKYGIGSILFDLLPYYENGFTFYIHI
jgi:hypothetical protein